MLRLRAGKINWNLAHEVAIRHFSFQANYAAAIACVAARQDHRLGAKEIRNCPGIDIGDRHPIPIDRDISQQRIAHALMKSTGGSRAIVIQANVFDFAASVLRHVVEQETIHAVANPKGEHPRVWMLLHFADDFQIVADITISHEAHDAHVSLCVRGVHRSLDGFHHLSATTALAGFEERLGLRQILFGCRNRFRK